MAKAKIQKIPIVEYEILKYVLREIALDMLKEQMVPERDDISLSRFNKGATKVAELIDNLAERRRHLLPRSHKDYTEKVE